MNIALITGASSGLGREFARRVSRDPHVQAVWAVARREDRLRQLASLCACPVRPVPLDLTDPQSLDALRDLLAREKPTVTRLVCAAGVGKMGRIDAVSPADSLGMIDLNCRAAVGVTQLCLPYLTRGSRVLPSSPCPAWGSTRPPRPFSRAIRKPSTTSSSPGGFTSPLSAPTG